MSRGWNRRFRHRRIIGGVSILILLILGGLILGYTTPQREEARQGGSSESTQDAQQPEKPYAAIPPPPDAEPLRAKQSTESTTTKRSVEVGRALAAGKRDRSGGPLKDHRMVAFYGTPISDQMGILGEYEPQELMRRLKKQTREYSAADPRRPAIPTIELIASVAQRDPGPEGLHVAPTPKEEIERYADLADEHDALLLLDVQLGGDSVMNEVKRLEPFLKRDNVHLAIDTEYSVEPGQVPGIDLGTVDGSDIQRAVRYMDRLAQENDLPPKVVVVHQFESGIVTNKQLIKPTDNVEVALNADGFGAPADKLAKYRVLVRQDPIQYGGFKLFYRQDDPLLSPERVVRMDPAPAVVNYQ